MKHLNGSSVKLKNKGRRIFKIIEKKGTFMHLDNEIQIL